MKWIEMEENHEKKKNIPWIAHFSNETREGNLTNKSITDVEKGSHSLHKGGATKRDCRHDGLAQFRAVTRRLALDDRKGGSKNDGDEGEQGRGGSEFGHHAKGTGQ